MTALQASIVKCYEELHLSIEDICEQFEDFDAIEIKMVLGQFSSAYRKAIKNNTSIAFTDEDHKMAIIGMTNLAQATEDENLQFRIYRYIREDATGRRDTKNLVGVMIPTLEFNEQMKKARLSLEKTRAIDITCLDVKQEAAESVAPPAPLNQAENVAS